MTNWTKVGTDVVVGGGIGAVDQLVQNEDDKRMAARPGLGMLSQYGTYYNYGIPILAVLGTAMGWLKGDMSIRLITAGSQLAGRKVIKQVVRPGGVAWTAWGRQGQQSTPLAATRVRAQVAGQVSDVSIPIIAEEAILV